MYLDLIAFKIENPQYKETHMIKQSLPKEVRESMSEEDKNAQPILGGLNVNLSGGSNSAKVDTIDEDDDLPF